MSLGDGPQLLSDVGQLRLHGPQAGDDRRERAPARRARPAPWPRWSRAPRSVLRAASAASAASRWASASAEDRLLGQEPLVLVVVGEPGRLDLVELVAQEVALAIAGRRVAAQRVELLVGGSPRGARRLEVVEVDAGEAIQGPSLARGGEQPHVGVLAVEVDEAGGQLGELRRP